MRAAQLVGPRNFEIIDAPLPTTADGNCLVEIESWSICGSDIRHTYGTVLDEEDYPMKIGHPAHEIAGTVVETRSDRFREGDRVIVLPTSDTALVEYVEALPKRMIALPDYGSTDEWLMCQPSGTVIYGCQRLGTLLGKNLVVLGQGAIGQSFTAILARSGVSNLIAVDPLDYRLEYSKKFGATHTVNPTKTPTEEAVLDILDGQKPDVVVEAAGYPDTLNTALRLIKSFGIVLMFGIQQKSRTHGFTVPMEYKNFRSSNARLMTVAAGHTHDILSHIELMVELKRRGWWDPAELITHRLSFDEVQNAFNMYTDHDDDILKVVMRR